ncbi:hypothetical protein [Serratia proteamaculans]|uniref:hypothetical protein n=1 Tax=Serratia proteamaculans TaxID=28151 RepID=UPI0021839F50|nr:hypothetical protein [Serratia proteamaculans]CAI2448862.1 Uncharacterised protein [Serratia proteamaculans]
MTGLDLAITIAIASIWAVIAFGLVGLFFYRYCKFCRVFNRRCLQPEERNYD